MGVTSDYDIKTYKHLVIKFTVLLLLYIIYVLIASFIFMKTESGYDGNDFIYHDQQYNPNYTYTHVLPEDEVEYLKNHSSMRLFASENNITLVKVIQLIRNTTGTLNKHYQILEIQDAANYLHEEDGSKGESVDKKSLEYENLHGMTEHQLIMMEQSVEESIWNIQDHGMNFLEAFVLTMSIVSTIGWGHVTPITIGGQAFAVFVALTGIPFTILTVISGCHFVMRTLKASLRNLFRRTTSWHEDRLNQYTQFFYKPILIFLFFAYIFVTTAMIAKLEEFSYGESLWYVMMAISTVGFGDIVQDGVFRYDQQGRKAGLAVFMMFWVIFGFISLGCVVLSFLYDYSTNGQYQNHFYKKNQEELVDDTDDYETNEHTGGNTIYTGGDIEG